MTLPVFLFFSPYTIIFSGVYIVRLDGDMYGYDNDNSYGYAGHGYWRLGLFCPFVR